MSAPTTGNLQKLDVLQTMGEYRGALASNYGEIATILKKRIINYVSDLEAQNQELREALTSCQEHADAAWADRNLAVKQLEEADPDALSIVHSVGFHSRDDEIRDLQRQLEAITYANYNLIDQLREQGDLRIGNIMMLVYMDVITEGRAREILDMTVEEFREKLKSLIKEINESGFGT